LEGLQWNGSQRSVVGRIIVDLKESWLEDYSVTGLKEVWLGGTDKTLWLRVKTSEHGNEIRCL
jgi:hypothetical protein